MDKDNRTMMNSIKDIIQDVSEEICDKLCKYRESSDEDLICDYIRKNGSCPLDRLR